MKFVYSLWSLCFYNLGFLVTGDPIIWPQFPSTVVVPISLFDAEIAWFYNQCGILYTELALCVCRWVEMSCFVVGCFFVGERFSNGKLLNTHFLLRTFTHFCSFIFGLCRTKYIAECYTSCCFVWAGSNIWNIVLDLFAQCVLVSTQFRSRLSLCYKSFMVMIVCRKHIAVVLEN